MSSSPVPLKIGHIGEQYALNLSRTQKLSRLCGVVVKRGVCPPRCLSRHLTMVQNYQTITARERSQDNSRLVCIVPFLCVPLPVRMNGPRIRDGMGSGWLPMSLERGFILGN
ncbi:hypothetical protein TNCV_537161 [Trichonephila clavipes]|nr:hypothetical protein TNCV_537161 [Trichonephila clavipes]